jgi:hypothetical protein
MTYSIARGVFFGSLFGMVLPCTLLLLALSLGSLVFGGALRDLNTSMITSVGVGVLVGCAGLFASMFMVAFVLARAGRLRFRGCTRCDYDRSGTMAAETCPECGLRETGAQTLANWKKRVERAPLAPWLVRACSGAEAYDALMDPPNDAPVVDPSTGDQASSDATNTNPSAANGTSKRRGPVWAPPDVAPVPSCVRAWVYPLWLGLPTMILALGLIAFVLMYELPADSRITLIDLLPRSVTPFLPFVPVLAMIVMFGPMLVQYRFYAFAKARGHCICTRCRYDRSGTMQTPTCPECGLVESGEEAVRRWKLFCSGYPVHPALIKWHLGWDRARGTRS